MKKYGVNELRKMYLDFFESKGHLVLKSFSLVPQNDNSLLLINAGMAQVRKFHLENVLLLVRNVSVQVILKMLVRQHDMVHSLKC